MKSDIIHYQTAPDGTTTQEKYCREPGTFCGLILLTFIGSIVFVRRVRKRREEVSKVCPMCLAEGTLTRASAEELLHCFWCKFNNQPAPPKVGVTAAESGTYTDFCQINAGGVREDGSDGVNAVSYLMLDVIEEMRLLQPSSSIQVSKVNPDAFIKRAARIVRTGFGRTRMSVATAAIGSTAGRGRTP